ncbi:mitochondrial associated ribonuclease, putative [Leishmania tarentolae]|uniref:Mitochondrial associated ribonuclease, putative n=1 Tax=Leishmania tarentolae TaxID=5689 RepID=A0A640KF84_LEITA|nr:mitochondrial associated ribonuclease, putative [Leishmania tarentolae]
MHCTPMSVYTRLQPILTHTQAHSHVYASFQSLSRTVPFIPSHALRLPRNTKPLPVQSTKVVIRKAIMASRALISPRSHLMQKFDSCRTIFMCCDIQEKLRDRISNFQAAVDVSNSMAAIHNALTPKHSTFVVTEQYPKGVGHIAKDIVLPEGTPVIEKLQPSMLVPEMMPYIDGDAARGILPVQQAVLWGHETHVCVLQTADELLSRNIRVAVLVDGCASQQQLDHDVAIQEMARWENLTLTTTISVLLQLARGQHLMKGPLMNIVKPKSAGTSRPPSLPVDGEEPKQ